MYQRNSPTGVALLVTVVVIGAVSVLVLGALLQTSLSAVTLQSFSQDELKTRQRLLSCMDETLAQFRRSVNFSETSINTGEGVCVSAISSNGNNRIVVLTATEGDSERSLEFTVDITTFAFSAFREF